MIGQHLNLPASKIYGVATFYNQFRFQAQGKNHIQVCRGTACHVKGSAKVLDAIQRELKIVAGGDHSRTASSASRWLPASEHADWLR